MRRQEHHWHEQWKEYDVKLKEYEKKKRAHQEYLKAHEKDRELQRLKDLQDRDRHRQPIQQTVVTHKTDRRSETRKHNIVHHRIIDDEEYSSEFRVFSETREEELSSLEESVWREFADKSTQVKIVIPEVKPELLGMGIQCETVEQHDKEPCIKECIRWIDRNNESVSTVGGKLNPMDRKLDELLSRPVTQMVQQPVVKEVKVVEAAPKVPTKSKRIQVRFRDAKIKLENRKIQTRAPTPPPEAVHTKDKKFGCDLYPKPAKKAKVKQRLIQTDVIEPEPEGINGDLYDESKDPHNIFKVFLVNMFVPWVLCGLITFVLGFL